MKCTIVLALYVSPWNMCYTSAEKDPQNAVSRSNWEFTNSIYTKISQAANPEGNIIFSPLSVQVILALCSMGAGGETAKQMLKGICLLDSTNDIKIGFNQILESLPNSDKVNLVIANLIFPPAQYNILKRFNDTAQEFFSSDVANINYEDSTNAARTINELVSQKTHKKITDIVSEDALDGNAAIVLANAVYFKGEMDFAFDKEDTTRGMFYVNGKDKKEMKMMQCKKKFNFDMNTELGAKLLEVPYMNNTMTFFMILPLENDGLPSVEAKLAMMELKDVYQSRKQYVDVHLSLPIFSIRPNKSLQLNNILEELEIVDMFGSDADFSGMSPEMGLSVSKVLHKAMIEVNEEGTVAVAEVQPAAGLSPQGERFVVDHPFTFALVSKLTNVVVLMGRYTGDEGETKFTYDTLKGGIASRKKVRAMRPDDKDFTGHRVRRKLSEEEIVELKEMMQRCADPSTKDYKRYAICRSYHRMKVDCKYPVSETNEDLENLKERCKFLFGEASPAGSSAVSLVSSWMINMSLSIIAVFKVQ